MHLQRCIWTHALHLLPCGFEEDLREAMQRVNARTEGTLRPHSPSNEVETNQIALMATTFPLNPHSNLCNLVGLLAAVQEVSSTTTAIVDDIQQSVEMSVNARQAITNVVNILHNYETECTPSPVQMVNPIKTIIQQQSTPPSYHCMYCHVITPGYLSIYCPMLKGKDIRFPIKDFKHPNFYAMLVAWELEEDEKYACACQEQDEARVTENDYDKNGHFISDDPIYWANQDE
ncbi:hypothetical protein BDR04DRAFT_1156762 [Suillus decipiens]|nr:hypothetical protein BDR04DRAFT_1156762 [Suillus decipiens]